MYSMLAYKNPKADLEEFSKKTMFFITAFIPLWAIIAINYTLTKGFDWFVSFGFSVFVLATLLTMIIYLNHKRKKSDGKITFKVVQKSNITHDIIFYVLAYIPVLIVNEFVLQEFVTFAILLFTTYVLYMKTNMLHVNPILALMKYHTYKITDDHDNTAVFFSKLVIKTGVEIPYNEITHGINIVLDK